MLEKKEDFEQLMQEAERSEQHPHSAYDFVIPGEIRAIPTLSRNEKYLYGIIRNLTKREGYCWATNSYLANEMECTERCIQKWLANLKNEGVIETEVINYKMKNRRRIWISTPKFKKSLITNGCSQWPRTTVHGNDERPFTHTKESNIHIGTTTTTPTPSTPKTVEGIDSKLLLLFSLKEKLSQKIDMPSFEKAYEEFSKISPSKYTSPVGLLASIYNKWLASPYDSSEAPLDATESTIFKNMTLAKAAVKQCVKSKIKGIAEASHRQFEIVFEGNCPPLVLEYTNPCFREKLLAQLKRMKVPLDGL